MSLPKSGRAISPGGERGDFGTVSQNALVLRLLALSAYARSRGVFFIWEQPSSTHMFRWRPMRRFQDACPDVRSIRCEMGCFGLLAEKETILWGTAPWLSQLALRLSPEDRGHLRMRPDRIETSHRWTDAEGRARCQGTKELHGTQAYTLGFGAAHALAYQDFCRKVSIAFLHPLPAPALPPAWFLADLRVGSEHRWRNDKAVHLVKRSRSPRARGSADQ